MIEKKYFFPTYAEEHIDSMSALSGLEVSKHEDGVNYVIDSEHIMGSLQMVCLWMHAYKSGHAKGKEKQQDDAYDNGMDDGRSEVMDELNEQVEAIPCPMHMCDGHLDERAQCSECRGWFD